MSIRQTRLYTDTCSIYKPTKPSGSTPSGFAKDALYTLVTANVKCRYFAKGSLAEMSMFGWIPLDSKSEAEIMEFYANQEIDIGYAVLLTTLGHPDVNKWFLVNSEFSYGGNYGVRAPNLKRVLVSRSPKPVRI